MNLIWDEEIKEYTNFYTRIFIYFNMKENVSVQEIKNTISVLPFRRSRDALSGQKIEVPFAGDENGR